MSHNGSRLFLFPKENLDFSSPCQINSNRFNGLPTLEYPSFFSWSNRNLIRPISSARVDERIRLSKQSIIEEKRQGFLLPTIIGTYPRKKSFIWSTVDDGPEISFVTEYSQVSNSSAIILSTSVRPFRGRATVTRRNFRTSSIHWTERTNDQRNTREQMKVSQSAKTSTFDGEKIEVDA